MTAPQTRGRKRQCAPLGQTGGVCSDGNRNQAARSARNGSRSFSGRLSPRPHTSSRASFRSRVTDAATRSKRGSLGGLGEKFAFRPSDRHTYTTPTPTRITGKGRAKLHPQFGSFLTSRSPVEAILAIVLLVCSDYGGGRGLFSSPLRRLFRSFSSARTHPLPNDPGDIPTAFSTLPSLRG